MKEFLALIPLRNFSNVLHFTSVEIALEIKNSLECEKKKPLS